MFLEKLEIQGFKSFATKTNFLFPKGSKHSQSIAAIVGPNGSGKSNVADAIRWVLGEQSLKNLRSKKGEDVIFFGSDKKSQLGSCEVSLTFNNEDHRVPIEYSQIVITRRLYRSGESEYCINKNKVRLSDVILLLAQGQVGQKSYSVIGQGMADGIINASPTERKEFFDEAAGVRQYQIKKDQASNRLKSTQENISQTELLLSELEPKLKFFQRHMKRLEQREEFEQRLHTISTAYYATQWNQLHAQRETLLTRRTRTKNDLETIQKSTDAFQQEFTQKEKILSIPNQSEYVQLKTAYDSLLSQKQSLLSEKSLLDGRLALSFEQQGKTDIAWLMKQQVQIQNQLALITQTASSATTEFESLRGQEKEVEKKLERLDNELVELLSQKKLLPVTQKISSLQEVIGELEEIALHSRSFHEQDHDHQTLKKALAGLTEKIAVLLEKVKEFSKKDTSPRDEEGEQIKNIREHRDAIAHEYAELRIAVRIKQQQLESIEKEREHKNKEVLRLEKEITYFSSEDKKEQTKQLEEEKKQLEKSLHDIEENIKSSFKKVEHFQVQEKQFQRELLDLQKELNKKQREMEEIQRQETECALQLARLDAHQEDLLSSLCRDLKIDSSTQSELAQGIETVQSVLGFSTIPPVSSLDEARREMDRLRLTLEQIGSLDTEALQEYESTKERYEFLTTQLADLYQAVQTFQKALAELDIVITQRFENSFKEINAKFDEYFKHLFSGGSAKLIVIKREVKEQDGEDEQDATDHEQDENSISGIDIHATPPGKKLKNVSFLSGGEKALTSIALLCAILSVNPSPFVVLDEVDAALDESNASRFASIIKDLATQTQFVIITHNRATIHTGDVLYGITMGDDGVSHSLSLDIAKASDTLS